MRTLCLIALIATCAGAARAQDPKIDEQPAKLPQIYLPPVDLPLHGKFSVTFHLCPADQNSKECQNLRSEWLRGKDEVSLVDLTLRDLRNQKIGQVDYSLRSRIASVSARLAKNRY